MSRINLKFPYQFDARGRTAEVDDDGHIRDLIEQVLFTVPGERVNRPDFGTGLLQLVFSPNSPELAASVQVTAQVSLQRWLSSLIEVQDLQVESEDSQLRVTVNYKVKKTQTSQVVQFTREGTP